MRPIAIFRQNLFRVSEVFIAQQAQALQQYRPVYLGRFRYGAGPANADVRLLRDLWPRHTLGHIGAQMLTRSPEPYVRLLQGTRPSLIHAHFGVDGIYALPLAQRLAVPLVTTFHGFDVTLPTSAYFSSPAWMNYPLFRGQLARKGHLFLCNSSYLRDRVLHMGFPADRTLVHYIGVDCATITPRSVDEETPTILHVARLVEFKGTEYLIRAFADIAARHPACRLIIIGDGLCRPRLDALVRSFGVGARVSFLGAQSHEAVMAWMRQAAIFVLPSIYASSGRTEGLGMVLLEAAATGVPIIGSRVGGIPECMIEGESGVLIPERNVALLAARMDELLSDPERRARMGACARKFVAGHFDLCRQTATLEGYYDDLLRVRRRS